MRPTDYDAMKDADRALLDDLMLMYSVALERGNGGAARVITRLAPEWAIYFDAIVDVFIDDFIASKSASYPSGGSMESIEPSRVSSCGSSSPGNR